MIAKSTVPKLRFPGFNGRWEIKKLSDATTINPKTTNLPDRFVYIDLESVSEGKLRQRKKILRTDAPSRAQRNLAVGDTLFQMVRPYQRNNYLLQENYDYYVASTGYAQIRSRVPGFTYQLIHTDTFVNKVLNKCTGTNYPAINSSDLGAITVCLPSDSKEQKKIAGFLTLMDERIVMIDKKVGLMKQYKKGVMQNIFTQKLSFKDENGKDYPAWQTKKLSDIANKLNSPISANEIERRSGKYKVFGASGFLQTLDSFDQAEEYTAIVKDGAGVGRLMWLEAKSSVLGTLNIIKPKANNDSKYLHYLLQTIDITKYSTGSTIPHVYFKDYAKQSVGVPSIKEQQKIAEFLTNLDDKINITENQLIQIKNYKKSLLQRMFV